MDIHQKFGDYLLLRRLAVGGQSEVFLAMKRGPESYTRPVVIKALPAQNRQSAPHVEMFYREAFISSRFIHPNVINIHDARMIEGDHCMLMDFVSGQTVADIAQRGYQRRSPPTLRQVAQIVADACNGLNYTHNFRDLDGQQYSVVHCDISPQNLMVTYNGDTMVFDFGIAHIIGYDQTPPVAGGKFAYMSPEQVRGEPVGPRSDIFSLGVILYELATGHRLFRRSTPPEVIRAVTDDPIPTPSSVRPGFPEALEAIILRALQRNPYERYASASDMRADLVRYIEASGERTDLRRSLGTYVAAMFKEERADIAAVLSRAPATESGPRTALSQVADASGDEHTLELEWSGEQDLDVLLAASNASGSQEIEKGATAGRNTSPGVKHAGETPNAPANSGNFVATTGATRHAALWAAVVLAVLIVIGLVVALAL